jgi:hypothetical protein
MTIWCRRENARRDALARELGTSELTEEQRAMEVDLADDAPWFRFMI